MCSLYFTHLIDSEVRLLHAQTYRSKANFNTDVTLHKIKNYYAFLQSKKERLAWRSYLLVFPSVLSIFHLVTASKLLKDFFLNSICLTFTISIFSHIDS
jgi:hypothetical protein